MSRAASIAQSRLRATSAPRSSAKLHSSFLPSMRPHRILPLVGALVLFLSFAGDASASGEGYAWGSVPVTFSNACNATGATAGDKAICERLDWMISNELNNDYAGIALRDSQMLGCILLLMTGSRNDPLIGDSDPGLTNSNSCTDPYQGGAGLTYSDVIKGVDVQGPIQVRNVTGEKLDVQCTTGSPPDVCAGSGGGGTASTVGIDPSSNTVKLATNDHEAITLGWYGAWALVGLLLCMLVVPRLYSRFRLDGSEL